MYFTYILKSKKDNDYYGHTSNIEYRLKCHNAGKVKSTKGRCPWKLHYYEKYENKQDAINRELFFKTIEGYIWLKDNKITER